MAINPNLEKYRRKIEPAAGIPEKPPMFMRFCNFSERANSTRYAAEINALYAGYVRELIKTGRKKEAVLKSVERIFEDLVVPKFGITGYELASGKRNFEYGEITEVLKDRVKEEYGVNAIPYAQEYMDRVMESIIIDNRGNRTERSAVLFPSTPEIRATRELPA